MITAPPVTLVIPGPPVGKGRARVVRTKAGFPVAFTPEKTRNYEATIRQTFTAEYPGFTPLDAPPGSPEGTTPSVTREWADAWKKQFGSVYWPVAQKMLRSLGIRVVEPSEAAEGKPEGGGE